MRTLKFKDIKPYISKYASPFSLIMREKGSYRNFIRIEQVPEEYDELYLYGIGSWEDYFDFSGEKRWINAIEIELSKTPRFSE